MTHIQIAETDDDIRETFEIMGQLHPNVLELGSGYLEYVKALRSRFFALQMAAVAKANLCCPKRATVLVAVNARPSVPCGSVDGDCARWPQDPWSGRKDGYLGRTKG